MRNFRQKSREFLAFLRRVHLSERPADSHPQPDIARMAVSLSKRRSCGFLRVMPALATFGRASRRKIAKVIKRAKYKSGGIVVRGLSYESGCRHFGMAREARKKHAIVQTGELPATRRRYPVCLVSLYRRTADSRFLKNAQTCQRAFSRPRSRDVHQVAPPHRPALSRCRGSANNGATPCICPDLFIFLTSAISIIGSQTAAT